MINNVESTKRSTIANSQNPNPQKKPENIDESQMSSSKEQQSNSLYELNLWLLTLKNPKIRH